MFKKNKKTKSKLDFLTPTVFSPVENIVEAAFSVKNSCYDTLEYIKNYLKGANILRRDLYSANINLAVYHLQNGNVFDAKLRYHVARLLRKTSTEPLLSLAEIAILQKKIPKAKQYFHAALELSQNVEQKEQILSIIKQL
jgi:Tfp pilus assembly protein PilF